MSSIKNLSVVVKIRFDLEKFILALFFAILLFIGPGSVLDHRIMHEFPYGYYASDTFQHQIRAESIKDSGNFRYEAFYIAKGFEKTIGRYPPLIYHLSVMFSYASGLETYDSIYFLVFFFAAIGVLVMYLVIRDFNRNIAIISLPLAILTFSHPALIGFTWGHWPSVVAQFFLIVFVWCIMRMELEKSYIFASISFSSIALAHTSEYVFAVIFLIFFLAIRLITKNLKKIEIKNIVFTFVLSFILSIYYLIIFKYTWAAGQPYSFFVMPVWDGNPGFYIMNFGALLVFIVAGIIFSLFRLRGMHVSLIAALAMFLSGFSNYIGFDTRAFQIRFFWPVYLAVFFGFGFYMLLKFAIKKWNMAFSVIIFAIFTVLLTGIVKIPSVPYYIETASPGIMDIYHWSALRWLSANTEPDSKIYFFYGDIYGQDALLRSSKRLHFQVDPDSFINAIKERKIKRFYTSELPGDGGGGITVRKGLFSFEPAVNVLKHEVFFGPQDICRFNYLIFDRGSRQQVLAQYNLLIASELLKKDYVKPVFENELVVILKNNNPGADCIEERNL